MRDAMRAAPLRVHDMLDNIEHVREATAGLSLDQYFERRVAQLAVERAIGIISEASRHLPDELKSIAPEIPWKKVAGIGNVLRHDYRDVAPLIIWNLVQDDLPQLEAVLRGFLTRLGETRD